MNPFRHIFLILWLVILTPVQANDNKLIRLATTTSTDNSGLLNELLPHFTADTGYRVHVIAVGTGKALKLGRDGDVDIVLVHAPKAEQEFVNSGHGVKRYSVMYNDFVVAGPSDDPAGIAAGSQDIDKAFAAIARSRSLFVSRGDNSGTHKKEQSIWAGAGIKPSGTWYREVGQGMGRVLQMANELDAYTLTDRGTWLAYEDKVQLRIAFEGDKALFNPYGIIAVNPRNYPDINSAGANALIDWITAQGKGQKLIGEFRLRGKQLFVPSAEKAVVSK